jgi:hypothetical protein
MRRAIAIGLLVLAGCSDSSDPGRYIPSPDLAAQALETALTAWRGGFAGSTVPGATNPAIEFVDTHRPGGRRLQAFTVVGQAPGDGPRVFVVKLSIDGTTGEQRVRYVVYGRDPVWVMRQEDYEMLNHWSHPPSSSDKTTAPRP